MVGQKMRLISIYQYKQNRALFLDHPVNEIQNFT